MNFELELGQHYSLHLDYPEVRAEGTFDSRASHPDGRDMAIFTLSETGEVAAFLRHLGGLETQSLGPTAYDDESVFSLTAFSGASGPTAPVVFFAFREGVPTHSAFESGYLEPLGHGALDCPKAKRDPGIAGSAEGA